MHCINILLIDFFNMIFKQLFLGCLLACSMVSIGQKKNDVLFTIDDKPYYTDEFLRIYNKNIDLIKDESQKDINQYLELFIGYKLKVNKAFKLELDKKESYINELKSNRTQLAKNYLTDSKVTQELIDEAYDRMQKEVRASHLLILVDENALPADTLAAYNKTIALRKRILNGEDFAQLAAENSMDTSAKENKGDLGYFSAFRMVYPFESGAFLTKKGEISEPVRTRFGYHLIKVTDIRANRGEMNAAHIMVMKANDSIKEIEAKSKINDIYKKIQQGENFENLAKEFSEDKSSSESGGVLNKFSSGQLSSPEFENVAFNLSKENPISAPFQSQFGWHIVKFIERFPMKTAKEMQQDLSSKISKDERSRKISNSVNNTLKKEYPVKRDDKMYKSVASTITADFTAGTWKNSESELYNKPLLTINKKPIDAKTFLNYAMEQQSSYKDSKQELGSITNTLYNNFVNEQLNKYADENLENKFPEFAHVVEEYRDGLLLFDLMEKEIWERAKTDSIGLKKFYEVNKDKYAWKIRKDLTTASSTKEAATIKAATLLKANKSADDIKKALNTENLVDIMINEGVYEEGNTAIPANLPQNMGITDIYKNGLYFYVTKVNKVLPAGLKTFEEAKSKVINDYQQYLEENWVSELKKEFVIKVNADVFSKISKNIKN